jgi:hypothetical protein
LRANELPKTADDIAANPEDEYIMVNRKRKLKSWQIKELFLMERLL